MRKQLGIILIFAALAIPSVASFTVLTNTTYAAPIGQPIPNQNNDQQTKENGNQINPKERLQFATGAEWIFKGLKAIGSFFAWIGGYLFDISLSWFVMDMKGTAEWLGITTVITEIWRMIRDLFNLLFIFGIIFVGFKLILGVDETNAKRTLGSIIVAALLINFSLYAAQVVVDFSNILTTEMSKRIQNSATNPSDGTSAKVLNKEVTNIADSFIGTMSPEKILNGNSIAAVQSAISKDISLDNVTPEIDIGMALIMGITSAFTLTLVGYVFAAGAFLMFARFLYLMFLMMFSPIMFLGFVLPNFKNKTNQWWQTLFGQALMGPAYLFMLFVALKALKQIKNIQSDSTLISYVMLSLIVCGFVWAALMTAQSMSKTGVSLADNLVRDTGRRIRSATGSMSFGLAAKIGRSQIGSRAYKYAESSEAHEAANRPGWRGTFSRAKLGVARVASDSSFDARKVGGVGKKLGIGEGRKGGFATITKEVTDREKKYAESLGSVGDDDPRVMRLQTEVDATDLMIKDKKALIQKTRKELGTEKDEDKKKLKKDQIEAARAELEDLEDKKKEQTENLSAEKQRIQLGVRTAIPEKISDANKEIGKIKGEIDELKGEHKAATDPAEKNRISKEIGDKKIQIARKQREQKMTYIKASVPEKTATDIATLKSEIKGDLQKYSAEKNPVEKDKIAAIIATKRKSLKDKEKEAEKFAGGYSATVEGLSVIKNLFLSRTKDQNENAAKEIRDQYKKNIKSKDK